MDLLRASLTQQLYDAPAGCTAHDGIVDQHDAFITHRLIDHIQLDTHGVLALALRRLDKRPPNIAVFDEADAVRNPRFLCEAERRVKPAVRHADYNVRLNRMLTVQDAPGALARLMDAHAVDNRIGPRKIDVFEYAEAALAAAVGTDAAQPVLIGDNNLTRFHVAQKTRADAVERAALGRKDIACFSCANTQRPKSVRIARGNQLFRRHNHKRIRALDRMHRLGDSLLDARR